MDSRLRWNDGVCDNIEQEEPGSEYKREIMLEISATIQTIRRTQLK